MVIFSASFHIFSYIILLPNMNGHMILLVPSITSPFGV